MHFDKLEIVDMISSLALLEVEAKSIRKYAKEQGPHAVNSREKEAYYIERKASLLKDDLIRKIS